MKNLIILTGAGMSAESGIATFRDADGLWENYKIEDVATPEGFARNPQLVLDFYNERRKKVNDVKPNQGHFLLADLQKQYNVIIITQNVDNLHEVAGSENVIHLHGELMKVQSVANPNKVYTLSPDKLEINLGDCNADGEQLRPHIVWFGEAVPMIDKAIELVQTADIFVIIGTSLNVYPAAGLVNYVSQEVPVYLIDPKVVNVNTKRVTFIQKGASEGVKDLVKILT